MEFPYPILEELLRVLMIWAIDVDFLGRALALPLSVPRTLLLWTIHSLGWS